MQGGVIEGISQHDVEITVKGGQVAEHPPCRSSDGPVATGDRDALVVEQPADRSRRAVTAADPSGIANAIFAASGTRAVVAALEGLFAGLTLRVNAQLTH